MEDEELIECVRQCTFIYDASAKGHGNAQLTKNAWEEIAQTIGKSVFECKKRWTSLRDQYRRNLRKRKSIGGEKSDIKWRLEDRLSFLNPHMKERHPTHNTALENNFTDSTDNISEEDETDNFTANSDQSSFLNSSLCAPLLQSSDSTIKEESPGSTWQCSVSCKRKAKAAIEEPTTAEVLQNYLASKTARYDKSADHIGTFFTAMEAATRRLPPNLQIEAKAKISALISDLEMRAYNEGNLPIGLPLQSSTLYDTKLR